MTRQVSEFLLSIRMSSDFCYRVKFGILICVVFASVLSIACNFKDGAIWKYISVACDCVALCCLILPGVLRKQYPHKWIAAAFRMVLNLRPRVSSEIDRVDIINGPLTMWEIFFVLSVFVLVAIAVWMTILFD